MGLKGNLAVVNLADVFQMLSRGKSTGLLRVQAPEGTRYIELQDGTISLAGRSTQYIQLGDLLLARKAIDHAKLETALKIHKENGMVLGQVLIEMNYVSKADLEDALHFLIEEEICDLFTLREGDFDFLASASLDTKIAPGGGAVRLKVDPDSLLLEAARRADEWHEIEQRLSTQSLLFRLTDEGQRVYKDADGISEEGRAIMRLLQANNTVEGVVQKSCLGRLNTNRMVLELWDAQLIEAVAKDQYLNYAKLQQEAGQLADAHRIAVHASKVGSPDTIKTAIPLIDTLRRQLGVDDKNVPVAAVEKDKAAAQPGVKRAVGQNLIIKRKKLPLAPIVIGALILAGAGYLGYAYFQGPDERKETQKKFDSVKSAASLLLHERKFLDAKRRADQFAPADPDFKKDHEKFRASVQTDIDTMLTQDIRDFNRKIPLGISRADLNDIRKRMKDYEGVPILSPIALKEQNKIQKEIPKYEEKIRVEEFKARLERLQNDRDKNNRTTEDLVGGYRELLKDDPPEAVAARARADLYKLQAPRLEARRQLAIARDLASKGGYESARKIDENIKLKFAGTEYAADADKNLKELADRETQASEDLAKIRRLVLQRKAAEAQEAAVALLKSNPPQEILGDTLGEMRKLTADMPEEELQQLLRRAAQVAEADPKRAREMVSGEVLNKYPYSKAAWSATLRVQIASSPEGAKVTLNSGNAADKYIGTTPFFGDLPAMGPFKLSFMLPGFEPLELVETNFRGDRIQDAVFIRKPQAATLAPIAASAGMLCLNDNLVLAGGNELVVCSRRTLDVLRRVNLEEAPQPMRLNEKVIQQPALAKGELKLRALSANAEEAEAYAFVSCTGPYFFQVSTNGTDFFRIPSEPGAVGEPQLYRPKLANATKQIALISKLGCEIFNDTRSALVKKPIPSAGGQEQPFGFAFDGDTFYVPRDNNSVYAVEGWRGEVKWEHPFPERISIPPAVIPPTAVRDSEVLGVSDIKGHVWILDAGNNGKEKGRVDLDAPNSLGLAASDTGFLAALDDNTLNYISTAGGKPLWELALPGKPVFTPQIRLPEKNARDLTPIAVVCWDEKNGNYTLAAISLGQSAGKLLWRARLTAKPVAITLSRDAAYVSTLENELLKFDLVLPQN